MRTFLVCLLLPIGLFSKTLSYLEKTYDLEGNCLEKIETNDDGEVVHKVEWEYDSLKRVIKTVENEQKITLYTYTKSGKLESLTKPNGTIITYEYDDLGRNCRLYSSDKTVDYSYEYNLNNQIILATDNTLNIFTKRTLDGKGRLLKETLASGLEISKEYDPLGRETLLLLPDHSSIEYVYDAFYLRYVKRLSEYQDLLYSHHYKTYDLSENLIEEIFFQEKVLRTYSYDLCGRKNKITDPHLQQEIISYDKGSRITNLITKTLLEKDQKHFSYDDLNHLIEETGLNSYEYEYDNKHNRITKNEDVYSINAFNQVTAVNNREYSYDLNGNLIEIKSPRKTTLLFYDALDRLTEIDCENTYKIFYTYDHLHRKIAEEITLFKEDKEPEEITYFYLYDETLEIGKTCEDGSIIELRVLGNTPRMELGASISIEIDQKVYIPLHDLFCNLLVLLDPDTNTIAESYSISSFGEMFTYSETLIPINPWRYCSKRSCPLTEFVFFGRRYYDPSLGRFISCDPKGFTDSYNLYCFVFNNPLSYFDPEGLETFGSSLLSDYSNDFISSLREPLDLKFSNNFNIYESCTPYSENSEFIRSLPRDNLKFSYGYDLQKENLPNGRIGFINGINTLEKESSSHMNYISDFADGKNVYGVYNRTRGTLQDLEQCVSQFIFNTPSKAMYDTKKMWSNFFKENKTDPFLHICHSQGALITRNALSWTSENERNRLIIVAIAPAAYINKNLCKKVYHYRSKNDIIPSIDVYGRYSCSDTTTILEPHKDAIGGDHSFQSPTYRNTIENHIQSYLHDLQQAR